MPDDLFVLYMEPLIKDYGWPFYSPDSPTNMPWCKLFDGLPFKTICELSWERQEIPFSFATFHRYAQQQIMGLLRTHVLGMQTEYADIPNTKARFSRARSYIGRTFRLPVPVVLISDVEGLRILDGNHRLAAMASFANADCGIIDCWVGTSDI
jgi:hypothetical protein